jgi:hypothetical protein
LVPPLAFAQPALGALSKQLRVHPLMLGAGGRAQKSGRQDAGAIGAKSGMGAGHPDAKGGKLMVVIRKRGARYGIPRTRYPKPEPAPPARVPRNLPPDAGAAGFADYVFLAK